MAKKDYMPDSDSGKAELFIHVQQTLPTFFSPLAISQSTPQVGVQTADALAFDYLCRAQQTLVAASQEATTAKNRLRDGDPIAPNAPVSLAFPLAPGTVPSPATPGVVRRFRTFASWLKSLPGYTPAIGEALRIIGEETTSADLSTVKPTLTLTLSGDHVKVGWNWEGLRGQVDSLEIQVDRGTGTYTMLTIDSRPNYSDTAPFGPTTARWKYKAIWRKNDERVGLWSDIAEILVG